MTPARHRRRSLPAALVLAAGVAGCASTGADHAVSPETYVVVIPAEDGHVGAVAVQAGTERQVLDTAYAAARSHGARPLERSTASAEEVERRFGYARAAKPAAVASFTVNFVLATDRLTTASERKLEEISTSVAARRVADILVVGHTDRQGTEENNLALSQRRAERVRAYLVQHGIREDIVRAVGRGEQEPLFPTEDEVQDPRNRRVEITVR